MAELEEIFQPNQTISSIGYNEIWNVRNQIRAIPIFKSPLVINMKMRARHPLA